MSPESFLVQERKSSERHILWNGEVFLMSGGTRAHSLLASAFVSEVRQALKGKACEAHGSDLRVHVPGVKGFVYPDASAACGPLFGEGPADTLLNPVLIAEVLSPSSEGFDRGEKFKGYWSIPSLRHYVLISQHSVSVEVFSRTSATEDWRLHAFSAGQSISLNPPGITLGVDAIYADVELSPAPPIPEEARVFKV